MGTSPQRARLLGHGLEEPLRQDEVPGAPRAGQGDADLLGVDRPEAEHQGVPVPREVGPLGRHGGQQPHQADGA
eukprot:13765561-Alexandrium_andersonii.AAC.1